jgi:hypothetical protein
MDCEFAREIVRLSKLLGLELQNEGRRDEFEGEVVSNLGGSVSLRCFIALICISMAACAQELPKLQGKSLNGHLVTLPDEAKGKTEVLVIGFSRDCSAQSRAWVTRIESDFLKRWDLIIFRVPFLEAVPRAFRGFALREIRKTASSDAFDTTVPVFEGEDAWKKLVGFVRPEEAYILVVDTAGQIRATAHGDINVAYAAVEAKLRDLLMDKPQRDH